MIKNLLQNISLRSQLFLALFLLVFCQGSFAQQFQHAEALVGLGEETDNNGVSIADYDQDGDFDIFIMAKPKDVVGDEKTQSKLFRNNNDGTFTNVTAESGIVDLLMVNELDPSYDAFKGLSGYKYGASWGDYNNDGYPDIFITSLAKVHLFHNNGDGTFQDITEDAGILQRNDCGNTGATWFDYNNDSYLDIYISDWKECDYNTMYRNNGDGTFTNVSSIILEEGVTELPSYNSIPYDFNDDGWMDLLVSNDLHWENQVFINQNGETFEERGEEYRIDTEDDDMGLVIGDYDGDGAFDIFTTAIEVNFLHHNDGNNTFSNAAIDNNVGSTGWAWGATFADFDLDSDEDLFIVNGFAISTRGPETNAYFKNLYYDGQDTFEEDVESELEDHTISVEAVDFDYDNDGDLDLIVTNSDRSLYFYENLLVTDPENQEPYVQWFKVSLQGTVSNRDAIGTILKLETTHGTISRYYTGVGFLGQSLKPVHFGLDPASDIISLTIEWPSGIEEQHTGLDPNSYIRAIENEGYELIESNPAEKPEGCTDPSSCNYDPNAVVDDGSCEYLDTSGGISGPSASSYFRIETYTYPLPSDYSINWSVEGGEIVASESPGEISVKWGFEEQGRVSAVINNEDCVSQEQSLNVTLGISNLNEQISVARLWIEAALFSIRNDYARPTVHARNLFHTSSAMYDAWAIFNNTNRYLIGNELNGYTSDFDDFTVNATTRVSDSEEAISYAAYRLLVHRFQNSPHLAETMSKLNTLMNRLGYNAGFTDTDYSTGNPAALGNYIAQAYIEYGLMDGSREATGYDNAYYEPLNAPLAPVIVGNPTITDPNRWQSLSLDTYIDQSGNVIEGTSIDFLSPEWGNVTPFAMDNDDTVTYNRDGNNYIVYNDPGSPSTLNPSNSESSDAYKWGFSVVSAWSSHLDPFDGIMWDISPASIGNLGTDEFPTGHDEFTQFYDIENGGVNSQGRTTNPVTGQPYEPQMVPRGDYTRVLAEFWADGPDSETPPGHWFVILNTVNDNPLLERRFNGNGAELSPLEWDVKAYFTLGGAMHDSAISAWSIKGWYDYVRPISAIRYMADMGQSSDPSLPNYHENGVPLIDGLIELVTEEDDELSGQSNENIGKVKVLAWKGHSFIGDTETEQAGVDWILAEQWWPYQRPSFVTPPFAGYVSGHSTYSRAAAEVMTEITGSEFFPGGMGEFFAAKNDFLVFEEGPSQDVVLQWATYRDASDQCSLSRIWGGIHPPIDDIPGRRIGEKVGKEAYDKAITYFKTIEEEPEEPEEPESPTEMVLYPNPVITNGILNVINTNSELTFTMFDMNGRPVAITQTYLPQATMTQIQFEGLAAGLYVLKTQGKDWKIVIQ